MRGRMKRTHGKQEIRRTMMLTLLCVAAGAVACVPEEAEPEEVEMSLTVSSTAFNEGRKIPTKYTCDGQDVSPPLVWDKGPEGTATYALLLEDPDAPGGVFTHWIVFNIPSDMHELPEAMPVERELPSGAFQGENDFGAVGYRGPCPPTGKAHRYRFKVYALDERAELEAGASRRDILEAMDGHILAQGELTGSYER
jgi:hypothetical protein